MRIGMVVPTFGFAGGIERHAFDLSVSLRARGHRVRLLYGPRSGRESERYAAGFDSAGSLASASSRGDLDVVYTHKTTDVDEVAALRGVPIAFVAHDHDLSCIRSHRYLPITQEPCHQPPGASCLSHGCVLIRDRRPQSRIGLRLANPYALRRRLQGLAARGPLVACSAYVARGLMDAGVAPSRVRVIHPVPPDSPTPLVSRPKALSLVSVGQLLHGKGFDLAIASLLHLPSHATLVLAGEGPSRGDLEAQAARMAPGRVRFAGYLEPRQVAELYDAARVVVVPSRWPEPFGMVGIEAMRRGRPVVASAHGGIPEWLEHGEGGRLFSPGDARELAEAVIALHHDEEAGCRARRSAARFSHEATTDEVERLLLSLVERDPS